MNPVLTVAIPTHNGSLYLAATIKSVLRQVQLLGTDRVQIVVANNGSTDETGAVLRSLRTESPIQILEFPNDLGYDRNILRLLGHVHSDYVWFFGDDDLMLPGALEAVLDAWESDSQLNFVLVPPAFFSTELAARTWVPPHHESLLFSNGEEFLRCTRWTSSALSSGVWRTSVLKGLHLTPLVGLNWIHFAAIVLAAGQPGKFKIVALQLIAVRRGTSRWADHFGHQVQLGIDHLSMIRRASELAEVNVYPTFREDRFRGNLIQILSLVREMPLSERHRLARCMASHFSRYLRWWALDLPLLYAPFGPRRFLYQTARNLKNAGFCRP